VIGPVSVRWSTCWVLQSSTGPVLSYVIPWADYLHCVECDIQEGSVIRSGGFFKEVVCKGKQWEGVMGAEEAHGFIGGGPSVCGRCCCAGSGRRGMVACFIEDTDRSCVSNVRSSSCPSEVHCLRPQVAACGGGADVNELRAAVSCTG
jgi:hypothetical protein